MKRLCLLCLLLSGCGEHVAFRSNAKPNDFVVTKIEHEGCDFLVFKEQYGDTWQTRSVCHDPKCKNCR